MNEYMKNTLILSAFIGFILQIYPKLNESLGIQVLMFFGSLLSDLELHFDILNKT